MISMTCLTGHTRAVGPAAVAGAVENAAADAKAAAATTKDMSPARLARGYIQSAWRGQASRVSTTSGGPAGVPGSVAVYRPR